MASRKLDECTIMICIDQLKFAQNAIIGPEFAYTDWGSHLLPHSHVQTELSPTFVLIFGEARDILFLFFLHGFAFEHPYAHEKCLFFLKGKSVTPTFLTSHLFTLMFWEFAMGH